MPEKKLDQSYMNPRSEGLNGEVKVFDRTHDRFGLPFTIPLADDLLLSIEGSSKHGEVQRYFVRNRLFALTNTDGRVSKFGDHAQDKTTVAIGAPYGEIDDVSSVRIHRDKTADPKYASVSEKMETLSDRTELLRRQLGYRAGEQCIDVRSAPTRTEKFDDSQSLNLQFMTGTMHLASVENFKPITKSSREFPALSELQAYRDKQSQQYQIDKSLKMNSYGTLLKTVERSKDEDIRSLMRARIEDFLDADVRGVNICRVMGVRAADIYDLEPNQIVELIGQVMYETTNYDHDSLRSSGGNSADVMDVVSVLENGLGRKSKRDVPPLGVCRNYAIVAQEMFYALKQKNNNLINTHCFIALGTGSSIGGSLSAGGGHAWVDFVMQADETNLVVATVDPTWTKKSVDGKLHNYDQTGRRIGTHVRTVTASQHANYASHKDQNSKAVQDHYVTQISKQVSRMKNRYGNPNGRVHLDDIPLSDPNLKKAMFFALEYSVFAKSIGGGYRFEAPINVKKLITKIADLPKLCVTSIESICILDQLCEDAEQATLSDERDVAIKRIKKVGASVRGKTAQSSAMNDGVSQFNLGAQIKYKLSKLIGDSAAHAIAEKLES